MDSSVKADKENCLQAAAVSLSPAQKRTSFGVSTTEKAGVSPDGAKLASVMNGSNQVSGSIAAEKSTSLKDRTPGRVRPEDKHVPPTPPAGTYHLSYLIEST